MSKNRSSALKREREQRKNEKRALKQQRREDRKMGLLPDTPATGDDRPDAPSDSPEPEPVAPQTTTTTTQTSRSI